MQSTTRSKQIGFIIRQAPYGDSFAREALEAVLATASFGQAVTVIFMDDGVFQLTKNQSVNGIEQKNLSKFLAAFELYDIDAVFACEDSLEKRQLSSKELIIPIATLNTDTLDECLRQQDILLAF